MFMGKSKKNRNKDKRSYAYYDDHSNKKSKNGHRKASHTPKGNQSYDREFTDWDSL